MGAISGSLVSVGFYGDDLDPQELTRLLKAEPSRSRRKGRSRTLHSGETRVDRSGAWVLSHSPERSAIEIDDQINGLLDRFTDDLAVWSDLTSRYSARIFCGLFLESWNEEFGLTPATIKRLCDRNLPIDVDIYSPTDTWGEGDEGTGSTPADGA